MAGRPFPAQGNPYERTKEELKAGKSVQAALTDGYKNAFSAIFDSNFTSIITGIILFYFGTGPIRGFATTLIIGIICSFFTAVFLTRIVYEFFLGKGKLQDLTFTTGFSKNLMQNTAVKFMEAAKKSFVIFGAAAVICIAFLAVRGLSKSIDFTGGRNFVVQFEQPVEPEAKACGCQSRRIKIRSRTKIQRISGLALRVL